MAAALETNKQDAEGRITGGTVCTFVFFEFHALARSLFEISVASGVAVLNLEIY